jgi:2-hydroxy-6-oxonona-2,4-dienedioate hydrolase
LNRHIAILEAKLLFLIRSSLSSHGNHIRDNNNDDDDEHDLIADFPYEVRRKINNIEEEIAYALRRKRNFESLRQMGATRYLTPGRYTSINNNLIRYLEYGPTDSNKILILLHGLGGSAERWSHVIPTLLSTPRTKDYRIIIPDIIGFGYSDKPATEYTMDFFINDFFIPSLDNLGISKANIIGCSFGGHLATEFAIRFDDKVKKLILVSPAGIMRQSNTTLESYARAASNPKYRLVYEAFREMVYDSHVVTQKMVRDFMNKMSLPNAVHAFMSTLYNIQYAPGLQNRLSNITAPTLIVWGDNDKMIPLAHNAQQFNGIPNRIMNKLLVVMEECGHLVSVEKPTKLGKIIAMCF